MQCCGPDIHQTRLVFASSLSHVNCPLSVAIKGRYSKREACFDQPGQFPFGRPSETTVNALSVFCFADHPRTGLVGGQKGVKAVCTVIVDHNLVRSWSELHRHPHHREAASAGVGNVNRGEQLVALHYLVDCLSKADSEKQICYMSSIGDSEYDHSNRKPDLASPCRGRTPGHPSGTAEKYTS
jgi:hypothetical protein